MAVDALQEQARWCNGTRSIAILDTMCDMKKLVVLLTAASLLIAEATISAPARAAAALPNGYTQAKLFYEEYGLAFAYQQSSILAVAAANLAVDAVGVHKAAYHRGVTELHRLASIPETGVTPAQEEEAVASIKELDVFFRTPGLYITVDTDPKVTPLPFPKCGATNLIELEDVLVGKNWEITVIFQHAHVVCGGLDDAQFNVYGRRVAERLQTNAAVFELVDGARGLTDSQMGTTTLQAWQSGSIDQFGNWYVYLSAAGTISALTQAYHP